MDSYDIIVALGGYRGLAEDLGEAPAVVHHWIRRGIPARVWPRVLELAEAEGLSGVTVQALADAAPGVPRRARKMSPRDGAARAEGA